MAFGRLLREGHEKLSDGYSLIECGVCLGKYDIETLAKEGMGGKTRLPCLPKPDETRPIDVVIDRRAPVMTVPSEVLKASANGKGAWADAK
jgi:hypothetical protein